MIREYKPTMRVLADRYVIARIEVSVPLCVWRLCERYAATTNANKSSCDFVTPYQILAWNGSWVLGDEVRAIRPVDGCACALCEARRGDSADG